MLRLFCSVFYFYCLWPQLYNFVACKNTQCLSCQSTYYGPFKPAALLNSAGPNSIVISECCFDNPHVPLKRCDTFILFMEPDEVVCILAMKPGLPLWARVSRLDGLCSVLGIGLFDGISHPLPCDTARAH